MSTLDLRCGFWQVSVRECDRDKSAFVTPFVDPDASSYAIGACLLQGESHEERPVEYASRLLTSSERNYNTTEREALAIVFGVQKFRGYLEDSKVRVASDHQPLKWLMSLRSPSGRLARWALLLQSYDLVIDYIPGRSNVIADTLSRPPVIDTAVNHEICVVEITLPTVSAKDLREKQLADSHLAEIIDSLEGADEASSIRWSSRGYVMANGVLYRYSPDSESEDPQLAVPSSEVVELLKEFHNSPRAGHPGVERTIEKLSSSYYWSTMRRDVRKHVQHCPDCQRYKCSNTKPAGLLQTPVMGQRFETIAIDLFGPLPPTNADERWVLAVEEVTTRWVELSALQKATAEACAMCLVNEIILRNEEEMYVCSGLLVAAKSLVVPSLKSLPGWLSDFKGETVTR